MATAEELKLAGFNDVEINQHIENQSRTLQLAGFGQDEINQHLGIQTPQAEPQFVAGPEPNRLTQLFDKFIREPITRKTGLLAPDIGFISERKDPLEEPIKTMGKLARDIGVGFGGIVADRLSGLSLNALDIAANKFDEQILDNEAPARTFGDFVRKIGRLEKGGAADRASEMVGGFANFLGRLKTVGKILPGPATGTVAKIALTGTEFGFAETVEQVAKFFTKDPTFVGGKAAKQGFIFGAALATAVEGGLTLFKALRPNEQKAALKLLKLKKGATEQQIRKAAQQLARKFHPDKVKGRVDKFKAVINARDVAMRQARGDIVTPTTRRGLRLPGEIGKPPPPFSQAAKDQIRQRVREATELQETQQAELDKQVAEIQRQAIAEAQPAEPGAEGLIIPPTAEIAAEGVTGEVVEASELSKGKHEGLARAIEKESETFELKEVNLNSVGFDFEGRFFVDKDFSRKRIAELTEQETLEPLILNKKGEVIDGNHRALAALARGDKTVKVYIPEGINEADFDNLQTRLRKIGSSFREHFGEPFQAQAPPAAVEGVKFEKIIKAGKIIDIKTAQELEAEATQALTDRRFEIKDIPPAKRTPAQIAELNQIEDELVAKSDLDIDITDKTRRAELKKTTDTIKESGIYQLELDVLADVPQLQGRFAVGSDEIGDVRQRFEGRPDILKKFIVREKGGTRWDEVADEIGADGFDAFMDAVEVFVESEGQVKGDIDIAALTRAVGSGDPQISFLALKHDMLKNRFGAEEINTELNELAEREQIDKNLIVPLLVPFERITDVQKKQAVLRELDKAKRPAPKKVTAPKTRAIEKARARAQKTQSPMFVRQSGDRFIITSTAPAKGAFIKITPPEPGQTTGKTEELFAGPTEAEAKEMDILRQKINIVASLRGISKKKLEELSKEHTGFKDITSDKAKITIKPEQLRSLLNNVRRLRPKRIGHRTVITPKTENQIASLKESLTKADLMTEPEFEKILAKETFGKLPKFIDSEAFITQPQGRAVINRMHDVAEKIRTTESLNKAIEKDPDIAIEFEKLVKTEHVIGAKSPARLLSMRFFEQRQAERTDEPIYHVWQDLIFTHQARLRERRKLLNSLEEMEGFTKIAKSPEAMQRVSDWISSQSTLIDRPESPKNITRQEKDLANRISEIFKLYELQARLGKFFEHKENLSDMPQYLRHKEAIDRALEIYNTEGVDPLIEYLRTQPWGIIRSGYEPMESVIRRVSTHKMPDIAIGKSHIKVRGITYAKQDRNILARLDSYMRQMDFIAFLQPKIKALVRTTTDVLDMFDNPRIVSGALSTFLDNLKKTNNEDGLVEAVFRKVYSQAITTLVLADISKPVRNLLQNAAFSEDRRDFVKLLKKLKPGEKLLTTEETEYLEAFVHQDRVMLSDWAFVGEEPFDLPVIGQFRFGIGKLTKWVQRRTLYPGSDRLNRTMSFAAKIDRVKTAFAKKQSLAAKMKQARFSDMQKQEQQLALGILARDGVNAMARYIAKVHTDNTHFLYAREQRSPAEQTKVGRLVLNLALFKRAALEKAVLQIQKVVESKASFAARRRAAFVFVNLIVWSTLVSLLWKKLTGKRFGAYDFINFLEFDSGGLQLGAVRTIENIYNNMLRASRGDTKALAALTIAIPKSADMFIPFYDQGLRAVEATLGTENIDREAFRKLRELIDSEYKSRGIQEVDRNLVEALQFVIAKGKLPKGVRREKKTLK